MQEALVVFILEFLFCSMEAFCICFSTKFVRHESHGHTYAVHIISKDSKWKRSSKSDFKILINVEFYCKDRKYNTM